MTRTPFLYCCALRMKAGELTAVRELATDVADRTLPRFILPPVQERDENQIELFNSEKVPDISVLLSRHWYGRAALIDTTYLLDECGRDRIGEWLPQMFLRARRAGVKAIPMAILSDIGEMEGEAFRSSISSKETLKFAICVPADDMVGATFGSDLAAALTRLGLDAPDCAIIADFTTADFSDPRPVAQVINGALEYLQELGAWRHIIFQGTHYPEVNPAAPDSNILWPRNEWIAWKLAIKFEPNTAENMMFGDYGADCAKMVFGGACAAPIKHYRYTTEDSWLVVRGPNLGNNKSVMQGICKKIVESRHFAGPGFSSADAYIYRTTLNQDGPGNSTIWRQVNTTHHITRVIVDLGKVRGVSIARQQTDGLDAQMQLLDL